MNELHHVHEVSIRRGGSVEPVVHAAGRVAEASATQGGTADDAREQVLHVLRHFGRVGVGLEQLLVGVLGCVAGVKADVEHAGDHGDRRVVQTAAIQRECADLHPGGRVVDGDGVVLRVHGGGEAAGTAGHDVLVLLADLLELQLEVQEPAELLGDPSYVLDVANLGLRGMQALTELGVTVLVEPVALADLIAVLPVGLPGDGPEPLDLALLVLDDRADRVHRGVAGEGVVLGVEEGQSANDPKPVLNHLSSGPVGLGRGAIMEFAHRTVVSFETSA